MRLVQGALLSALALILMTGAGAAQLQEPLEMCEDPWPPYTLGEAGGEPTGGYAVELNREVFRRLDIAADLKLFPWKRCLNQMKKGTRDGLMLLTKSAERAAYMTFTDPIMEDRDLIWFAKDKMDSLDWTTFEDLKPYHIGESAGFNYGNAYNEAKAALGLKASQANSDMLNFRKLARGRIDIFICNETAAREIFKKNPDLKGKFGHAEKPLKQVKFHMSFSKKSPAAALVPRVNAVIADMKADGTIDRILGRD